MKAPPEKRYESERKQEMILDLKAEDINFNVLKSAVGSKIYYKLYDWFLNHREDGTPFPDVGDLFADYLLEYSRRGGNVYEFFCKSLIQAYIDAVRDSY